jgi:uncharacterized protein (TIGR03437 family)
MLGPSLDVNVDATNLKPRNYTGTITVTPVKTLQNIPIAPSAATVSVSATVLPPPSQITVTPASLALTTAAGSSTSANLAIASASEPALVTIRVTGTGLSYSITPAGSSNQFVAPATIQIAARSATPGTYGGSVQLAWTGGSLTVPVTVAVTGNPATPPVMTAVVASGSALISIFGSGIGGAPATLQLGPSDQVTSMLGSTQVMINGIAALLIYVSPAQVNAIVPYEVAGSAQVTIQVLYGASPAPSWSVPVVAAAPSVFTVSGSGVGQASVVNADGSVNSASNPAARGTIVQIYATGGGQTTPGSSTGLVAAGPANLLETPVVQIGGVNAQVIYAGAAPGEVDGVVQLNVLIPVSLTPGGALPVVISIGGLSSQTSATIAVN